jgi:hypothetical protein
MQNVSKCIIHVYMLAKAYTNSYSDKQNKSYLVEDIN